jgi:Zn-dependent metalloprotease
MTRSLCRALLGAAVVLSMLAVPAAAQESPVSDRSSLLVELGASRVQRHSATGQLRFVSGSAARPAATSATLDRPPSAQATARRFMERYGSLFGIADASRDLRVARSERAIGGNTFVRYQQLHRGVPVLGGELSVQVDAAGNVISANGEASPDVSVDVTPAVTSAAAARAALAAVAKGRAANESLSGSEPSLWVYDPALLGGRALPFTRLVWRTEVRNSLGDVNEFVLIDAQRGGVALRFDQVAHAKNRITCDANSTATKYPCTLAQAARTEASGPSSVADVNNAHVFSGHTYDFFFNRFGRDSLDGAGMQLKSTVRYCPDAFNCPYQNAFWDGEQMVYGTGFANADDVVGHELAHGVTDHTSSLYYYYQSGAINEALSDIFGEYMDLTNGVDGAGGTGAGVRWLVGEDLPSIGAIRDMEHPPTFGDPDRMQSPNYWDDLDDNGGVHINSGVANKAAYLMTDGGSFNGQTLTPIGIDRAAAIWYRVEANYLGSASDYADLGAALSQACTDLVGSSVKNSAGTVTGTIGASDCTQVGKAVTATEMALQPLSPDATAPDAAICATGTPSNVVYDQIASGAPGWTTSGGGAGYGWFFGDWYATSPDYHLYGYMDNSATPPAITRTNATTVPANAFLHFRHAYEFEWYSGTTYYDGGVLEYSTNGGTSWSDASLLPATNGYDGVIASGFGNPLQGRSAFVGISHGYMSSRYDLSSLSGQNVKFRFRVSSDSIIGFQGWYVDDFRIYTCSTGATTRQPDGRIALGSGTFVGDGIYNTTAIGQKKTGSAPVGGTITFKVSVQNDGTAPDSFRVLAAGSTTAYSVKYKVGATDITTAVVAGTYTTPSLAVGATHLITVKVKVKSSAAVGSKVSRKATITSVGDTAKQDAVKFIGKRS